MAGQDTPQHRPHQDSQAGAGLHQSVSAQEFVRLQQLRQNAVLYRAEKRGLAGETEKGQEKKGGHVSQETCHGDQGNGKFATLKKLNELGFVHTVGQLSTPGGEQQKRRDEDGSGDHREFLGLQVADSPTLVQDENNQGVLKDVIV